MFVQNVNTVDVIFPSWPIWLYTNPDLGKYLLLPLFEYQATGQYPNKWAVHDMGASYPKALGHNDGAVFVPWREFNLCSWGLRQAMMK